MSLTSYRAAPPRVNSFAAPQSKGAGTYSRFEDDVKRLKATVDRPRRLIPYMGFRRAVVNRL